MMKMEKCYNGIKYVRVSKPAMFKHLVKAWNNKDRESLQIGVCMNKQRALFTIDMYNRIVDRINLYSHAFTDVTLTDVECIKIALDAVTNNVHYYNSNSEYGYTVCYFIKKGDC